MSITKSTIVVYEYSGSTNELTIPFDYLKRDFVVVALGGDGKPQKALKLGTDYRFDTKTTIVVTRQYQADEGYNKIIIRRVTDASKRIINYQDGSILNASELNTSQLQALHVAEEARDLANYTLFVDDNNNLDARGRKIINLGDPTNPQDAVTKKYVDTASESVIDSRNKALQYRDEAEEFKNQAQTFRNEAEGFKNTASAKADEISAKIAKADELNTQAVTNSDKAKQYALNAQNSASTASQSEKNAQASDKSAANSAKQAAQYAASVKSELLSKFSPDIETLKATEFKEGDVVYVGSYYSNVKDDSGHYRVIARELKPLGITMNNGLVANLANTDDINVKWNGAKGDGATNDTKAFQDILDNYLNVYVPSGTYLVDSVKISENTIFHGDNYRGNAILKQSPSVDAPLIGCKYAGERRTQNTRIRGFLLKPNSTSTKPVIDYRDASYSYIHDIQCSDSSDGGSILGRDFILMSVVVFFNGYNEIKKINALNMKNGIVATSNGLKLENIMCNHMAEYGVKIYQGAEFIYENGECSTNGKGGILIEETVGVSIRGVWFERNPQSIQGAWSTLDIITNNCKFVDIKSCRFDRNDYAIANTRSLENLSDYSNGIGRNKTQTSLGLVNGSFKYMGSNSVPLGFETKGSLSIRKLNYSDNLKAPALYIANLTKYARLYQRVIDSSDIKRYVGKKIHLSGSYFVRPDSPASPDEIKINLSNTVNGDGNGIFLSTTKKGEIVDFTYTYVVKPSDTEVYLVIIKNAEVTGRDVRFEIGNLSVSCGEHSFIEQNKLLSEDGGHIYSQDFFIGGQRHGWSASKPEGKPAKYKVGDIIYNTNVSTYNNVFAWVCTYEGSYNSFKEVALVDASPIVRLNTPYHAEKMKQEGVFDDFITYMDEVEALKHKEVLLLNLLEDEEQEEPKVKPSEALIAFASKYGVYYDAN